MNTPPDSPTATPRAVPRISNHQSMPASNIRGRQVTQPTDNPRTVYLHTLLTEEFLQRHHTSRESISHRESEEKDSPGINLKDKFKGKNPRNALKKSRSIEECKHSFSYSDENASLDLQKTAAIPTRKKRNEEAKQKDRLSFASEPREVKDASLKIHRLNLQTIQPDEKYPYSARESRSMRDMQPDSTLIKRKKKRKKKPTDSKGKEISSSPAKDKFKGRNPREALRRSRSNEGSLRHKPEAAKVFSSFVDFNSPQAAGLQSIAATDELPQTVLPTRKKGGSFIGFFNFASFMASSDEKAKRKEARRRSRTLSSKSKSYKPSKRFPLHNFSEKPVRHLARNLLIAFSSIVETTDPYNLLRHRPFKQYKDELNFIIFKFALAAEWDCTLFKEKVSLMTEEAWRKLRKKNGFLLAGARARINKMQMTLESNFGPKETKSPRDQQEFIDQLKNSLAHLQMQKSVGNFLAAYESLPPIMLEFVTHILHPNTLSRLKKFQHVEPSNKFKHKFGDFLYLVHYLRNIQEEIFSRTSSENESGICQISCEDIKRTYTSHKNAFNFREIVLERKEGNITIGKETGSARCMSIPTSNRYSSAENYARDLFSFLINKIIQSGIHFPLPNETVQYIADEIATGGAETLLDSEIPILSSDFSYSESEDSVSDMEGKKSFIIKILQTTSFANSNNFTIDFIEHHSGIFNLNQKMNYFGLFKDDFDARFSGTQGSRSLKIGAMENGFYTDQIMILHIFYKDKEFLTFRAVGRTEYNYKRQEFVFRGINLIPDEDALLRMIKHSGNTDGEWTFNEFRNALEKFIVVMRYIRKESTDSPFDFHSKRLLKRFGYISVEDSTDSCPSITTPTFPNLEGNDGITRDDTDDELRFIEDGEGKEN